MPKNFEVIVGMLIGTALERLPRPVRRSLARGAARLVALLPGGGWAVAFITPDDPCC